jgi:hypothetical protein
MAGGDLGVGGFRDDVAASGAAIGVLAEFPIVSSHFAIRGDVMFHYLTSNCPPDVVCSPATPGSATASLVAWLNDARARWSPYAIAGIAGFLNEHWTSGFAGGGGIEFRQSERAYFVEARYMSVGHGGFVPITIGMRF